MNDYKPGDRVTLEHQPSGASMVNFTVEAVGSLSAVRSIWQDQPIFLGELPEGWRVTKHKRQPEPLPTEPGAYVDCHGAYWLLAHAGDWYSMHDLKNWKAESVSRFAPLTRLVPVGSEAREVLNWIRDSEWSSGVKITHIIAAARKRFGVNG